MIFFIKEAKQIMPYQEKYQGAKKGKMYEKVQKQSENVFYPDWHVHQHDLQYMQYIQWCNKLKRVLPGWKVLDVVAEKIH